MHQNSKRRCYFILRIVFRNFGPLNKDLLSSGFERSLTLGNTIGEETPIIKKGVNITSTKTLEKPRTSPKAPTANNIQKVQYLMAKLQEKIAARVYS